MTADFANNLVPVFPWKYRVIDASTGVASRKRHLPSDLEFTAFQRSTWFADALILTCADRDLLDADLPHSLQLVLPVRGFRHGQLA